MPSLAFRKGVFLPVLAMAAVFSSCTAVEDNDSTNTLVYVSDMAGANGDEVFSDVCTAPTGAPQNQRCTVINDTATVTVTALPKDQLRQPGQFTTVYFTRYRVTFIRADGRAVPGVEVPYPFDGATNFTVQIGTTGGAAFTIVRQQAKLESPLINMQGRGAGPGGGIVLSVLAQVDFYGTDVAGRPIKVTGFINVTFGDFPG